MTVQAIPRPRVPGVPAGESPDAAGELAAWPLLSRLAGPADVRRLPPDDLPVLAGQIRDFLVRKVCASGGHLGVNLGVVELTIALHRVFDSPRDVLLFDTGHQAYVHKILTGRADRFGMLRQAGGLSGYPSRGESAHDWIESSHASSALSYADGLANAFAARGEHDRRVIAIVGDGALTGGIAWEGLNNLAQRPGRPVVVVLNDNGRSYDPTVGGLARHLAGLRRGRSGSMFEQLGLDYLGPVNGHDLAALHAAFTAAGRRGRTIVVHCVTAKGKGYAPAEADEADRMHGIGVLDPATGRQAGPAHPSWTSVFGQEMLRIGGLRPDVVAVTAAMLQPTGLKAFAGAFPHRVFDVGIAEQQAVCSAAGLAMGGLHPVVCLYATFLNRAYDQVLMDVALHRLPVTFVLDRAGLTGPDGPSHHGMWDTAMLATAPGFRVAAPRDLARLRELVAEAIGFDGPAAIRFPKATAGPDIPALTRIDGIDILHRSHRGPLDVLLIAAGPMAAPCLAAAAALEDDGAGVTVADPRWILPVSPSLIHLATRHRLTVAAEDAPARTGAGALLAGAATGGGAAVRVLPLGLPSSFIPHGDRDALLADAGLDGPGIARSAAAALAASPGGTR